MSQRTSRRSTAATFRLHAPRQFVPRLATAGERAGPGIRSAVFNSFQAWQNRKARHPSRPPASPPLLMFTDAWNGPDIRSTSCVRSVSRASTDAAAPASTSSVDRSACERQATGRLARGPASYLERALDTRRLVEGHPWAAVRRHGLISSCRQPSDESIAGRRAGAEAGWSPPLVTRS